MFAYCGNRPVIRTDSSGELYVEKHPVDPKDNGFQISMSEDFKDPEICLYYAYEIVDTYGNGQTYYSMDAERIALEIYAHAWLYYFGMDIDQANNNNDINVWNDGEYGGYSIVGQLIANYCIGHGAPIDVNNDESDFRLFCYKVIWHTSISGAAKASVHLRYISDQQQEQQHPRGGPAKDMRY